MGERNPPSCPERGDIARGAALKHGATPLEALIVGQVASYGSICWLKDREIAEDIVQRNGRNPHPGSVSRARRNVSLAGLMRYERLMPGRKLPGMRRPVTYGSTAKIVIFDRHFGVKDPLTRGQKRRLKLGRLAIEPEYAPDDSRKVSKPGQPKHSAQPSPVPSSTGDSELDALIATVGEAIYAKEDRQHEAEDRRMMDAVHALRRAERSRAPPRK